MFKMLHAVITLRYNFYDV